MSVFMCYTMYMCKQECLWTLGVGREQFVIPPRQEYF